MKYLCMVLLVFIFAGLYCSCADEKFVEICSQKECSSNDFVVYPLAEQSKCVTTRAASAFDTDWENQTFVRLNSGERVNLPWSYGDANLPIQMRYDVKKEDGWTLILHTFSNPIVVTSDANYMFLYNQRTGFLKVLYYVENVWANNIGFWKVNLGNQRHQLFNHTGELALPMNINYANNWITTNASSMEDLSFRKGWNGFQVQLAYDTTNDDVNSVLDLKTANANITRKTILGEFDGYSQGTLVTHGSKNSVSSLVNDIASVFGNEAQNYVKNRFGKDDSAPTRSITMAAGIADAVVKWGANKVLGAITDNYKKRFLQFSYLGKLNIQQDFLNTIWKIVTLNSLFIL